MTSTQAPSDMLDHKTLNQRRQRAARRQTSFLIERAAQDAADRVCDINRVFESALIIGSEDFLETFLKTLPSGKHPKVCNQANIVEFDGDIKFVPACDEPSFDLIISGLTLQSANDVPGVMRTFLKSLSPDGLFIAGLFGGNTLTELRQSFYKADDLIFGGMSAHIYPFADYSQAANLLQGVGFALPVVDSDRFNVSYRQFSTLIEDLRDLGETNVLNTRQKTYLGKIYLKALEGAYSESFSRDGKLQATFEILWLTGWSPHNSQQKPLKPGSAKMRLADALGTKEHKL